MSKETQKTISEWIETTFGPADSNVRVVARINEEMAELIRSVALDESHQDLGEEMADILICMYRLATRVGVDLNEQVDRKMEINRKRTWKLDGSGCGYHT